MGCARSMKMEVGARYRIVAVALAALAVLQAAMAQETIRLKRGLVIPVRFQDELSLRDSRVGDRFSAIVENDRDLPSGTVFEGRVSDIRRGSGDKAGYMDLDFESVLLPDGGSERI